MCMYMLHCSITMLELCSVYWQARASYPACDRTIFFQILQNRYPNRPASYNCRRLQACFSNADRSVMLSSKCHTDDQLIFSLLLMDAGYWAVDAKADTAIDGVWRKGPGRDLFDALEKVSDPHSRMHPSFICLINSNPFVNSRVKPCPAHGCAFRLH